MIDPKWLKIAKSYEGVREIPGPKTNPIIAGWLRKLNSWIKDDETPWCGNFVAAVMQEAGLPYPTLYPRAKAWATYGARLREHVLAPGAIMVFGREGGGHVGFYLRETRTHYEIFGGNQKNMVCRMWLKKDRLIASRWPKGEAVLGGPVFAAVTGETSTNEA